MKGENPHIKRIDFKQSQCRKIFGNSNFQLLDLQLRSPRIAHPSNILASVY